MEDLKPRPASEQRLPPAPAVRAFKPPNPLPPGPQQSPAAPRIARASEDRDACHGSKRSAWRRPRCPALRKLRLRHRFSRWNNPSWRLKRRDRTDPANTKVKGSCSRPRRASRTRCARWRAAVADRAGSWWATWISRLICRRGFTCHPQPGRTGSSLELMSDPMGADFRPYLIRILALVRRIGSR